MTHPLDKNIFFIKEHVGIFKASNNFDILDPETREIVMECREPNLGFFTKLLRFTDYKRMTPFDVEVRTPAGELVVRVKRNIAFLISKVHVFDGYERPIGQFKQKFFSIGGKFDILNMEGEVLCTLKGKWTGWDFRFIYGDRELAHVTKKWAGLGKELFSSADNYILEISPDIPQGDPVRQMILAAVMCIDMVLKE